MYLFLYNYFTDIQHLNDQISYFTSKVRDLKEEKEKVLYILDNLVDKNKLKRYNGLQSEIKNYQSIMESCKKASSQLTEEVIILKSELDSCITRLKSENKLK
jgi:hypothetical protein